MSKVKNGQEEDSRSQPGPKQLTFLPFNFWMSHTLKAFEMCLNVHIFALFVLYLQIWRGTSESQYVGVFWEFDILG